MLEIVISLLAFSFLFLVIITLVLVCFIFAARVYRVINDWARKANLHTFLPVASALVAFFVAATVLGRLANILLAKIGILGRIGIA